MFAGMQKVAFRCLINISFNLFSRSLPPRKIYNSHKNPKRRIFDPEALQHALTKQIIQDEQQLPLVDNSQALQYFKTNKWNVNYKPEEKIFNYSRYQNQYELQVVTPATNDPPNNPDHPSNQKTFKIKFSYLMVFLRKLNTQKWLHIQILVLEGGVESLSYCFTGGEPRLVVEEGYSGPDISYLPVQLTRGLSKFLEGFGLTAQMAMNMVLFSSSSEGSIDLNWLRSCRDILT